MIRTVILIGYISVLGVSAMADDTKTQFTGRVNQLDAMRSLPGVFQINLRGDYVIEVPETVQLKLEGLDELYQQARSAGAIEADVTLSHFKWMMVASNPANYLAAAGRKRTELKNDFELGWGTGFAISREGYVLTNRHVVAESPKLPLLPDNLFQLKPACMLQLSNDLVNACGEWKGDPKLGAEVVENILSWLGSQCVKGIRHHRPSVVVTYADPKTTLPNPAERTSRLFGMASEQRIPVSVPTNIIFRGPGEGYPTDVAILKIDADVLDALVCLPLARPGQAKESMSVYSLGFPGYRYNEATMSSAELRMVNVNKGTITWTPDPSDTSLAHRVKAQTMRLGSEIQQLLVVTATIRQGASGGPVVLEDGTAVGLNVAFAANYPSLWNRTSVFGKKDSKFLFATNPEGDTKSLNVAVPIEVAIKMLAQQKITPDVGPTTQLWREGMSLYEAGMFAEALAKFEQVAAKQVISRSVGKPYEPRKQPLRIVSHYVQEMIDLCRAAAVQTK